MHAKKYAVAGRLYRRVSKSFTAVVEHNLSSNYAVLQCFDSVERHERHSACSSLLFGEPLGLLEHSSSCCCSKGNIITIVYMCICCVG